MGIRLNNIISSLLTIALCVGLAPASAFAAIGEDDLSSVEQKPIIDETFPNEEEDSEQPNVPGEDELPMDEVIEPSIPSDPIENEDLAVSEEDPDEDDDAIVDEPIVEDRMSSAKVDITQTDDQKMRGAFSVVVSGLPSTGIAFVEAPTWSEANGQDDLEWYRLTSWQGVWTRELPCLTSLRGPGIYHSHIYLTAGNGVRVFAGGASANITLAPSSVKASVNAPETWFSVSASGGYAAMADAVQFAVWSDAGGQDDLRWYSSTKRGAAWGNDIPVSLHATAGNYQVHAYALKGTQRSFVGGATFKVSAPTGKVKFISSKMNGYTIQASDVRSPSGISGVSVGAWALTGGQDDLAWHDADRQGDTWVMDVSASRHLGQDGIYENHVYATCKNGVKVMIGSCRTDSIKTSVCPFVSGTMGSGKRTLGIKNPPNVTVMSYAVWSDEGGQDDLVWYDLAPLSSNTWAVDIDCHRLKYFGTVTAHLYSPAGFITAITFEVGEDDILPAPYRNMDAWVSGMWSPTDWFLAVDTYNCFVGVYHWENGAWKNWYRLSCSPGKPSTPTVKGVFRIQSRGYSFGSGYTCYYWTQFYGDYLFHSILYDQGTFNVQDGRLGEQLSHGCVRMDIWDAKWIHDVIPTGTTVYIY